MKILTAFLICCLTSLCSFAAEETLRPEPKEWNSKDEIAVLQRIEHRINAPNVSVRVQSYDSAEAAEQGSTLSMMLKPVMWTRQENFGEIRLYVWDTTMGSGKNLLRVGPSILFRLDKDVIDVSWREQTASRDFIKTVLEIVRDELKTARK